MDSNTKLAFTLVARMRRTLRLLARRRDALHADHRVLDRKVRVLRRHGTPFDAFMIKSMDLALCDVIARIHATSKDIDAGGKLLVNCAPLVDAATSLSERCDILNVNTADRRGLTEADGVLKIVFVHGLEDSAERRRDDCKNGPLFKAVQPVMLDFLCNTPEGKKLGDSLFEAGGMFLASHLTK